MSLFQDKEFEWRDTYFVLFQRAKRPQLDLVRTAVQKLNSHFEITSASGDDDGLFEAMTVRSPEDGAALDISFLEGEDVVEQRESLARELKGSIRESADEKKLARLPRCDARFDVLHFEQLHREGDEEEIFDPGALLAVVETLAKMTGGVGVDPQSGTML